MKKNTFYIKQGTYDSNSNKAVPKGALNLNDLAVTFGRPYKSLVIRLSQAGGATPTMVVTENTFDTLPTWSKTSTGVFTTTAFLTDYLKADVQITIATGNSINQVALNATTDNKLLLNTRVTGTLTDNFTDLYINVKQYV